MHFLMQPVHTRLCKLAVQRFLSPPRKSNSSWFCYMPGIMQTFHSQHRVKRTNFFLSFSNFNVWILTFHASEEFSLLLCEIKKGRRKKGEEKRSSFLDYSPSATFISSPSEGSATISRPDKLEIIIIIVITISWISLFAGKLVAL